MNTGDYNLIKNLNRQIILEKIIEEGSISRAQLSKVTGLNKATISVQIAQLLEEGIVIETKYDQSTGGRKPILLSLNQTAGYAVGIELDGDYIYCLLTDLEGNMIAKEYIKMDTSSFVITKKFLKEKIAQFIRQIPPSRYGVVGISVGIHGIVDKEGKIVFAIHSNWKDVDLKTELFEHFHIPIYIDNNTNLCAYAEKTFSVDDKNVLCLTTTSGIGLGIVIDNVVFKGLRGFAGEIGHMIIKENGKKCSCGNRGCWELYASEKAFLEDLAIRKKVDKCTLEQVKEWMVQGDQDTLKQMKELAGNLSIGINNVINIFNPETIIINSELIAVYPRIIEDIKAGLRSSMNDYRRILYSKLGKDACALGACAIAIENFLKISDLKLTKKSQYKIHRHIAFSSKL